MRRLWPLLIIVFLLALCTSLITAGSTVAVLSLLVRASTPGDTVPARELAFPDSHFAQVMGVEVHYQEAGQGEPAFLLLHGLGASTFSWRDVLPMLEEYGRVVAFDRPGFGLSERPLAGEYDPQRNPYSPEFQADLTVALMDELGIERAVLVGHSAGGAAAVLTALRHPDRVQALILVSPAVYEMGRRLPDWAYPLLRTPPGRQLGLLLLRLVASRGMALLDRAYFDPSLITPEIREGYSRPLQVHNADRALWEFFMASSGPDLGSQLGAITVPALVITGEDDRIVPAGSSARVAAGLPRGRLEVIPNCGHIAHEECPGEFEKLVALFLAEQAIAP
ncbi:MAG: alpha/beta fold hydrolase [Anaerolineae bacterium]|jgi:pimeloyl-ACP methyl ester carboxylesterase